MAAAVGGKKSGERGEEEILFLARETKALSPLFRIFGLHKTVPIGPGGSPPLASTHTKERIEMGLETERDKKTFKRGGKKERGKWEEIILQLGETLGMQKENPRGNG